MRPMLTIPIIIALLAMTALAAQAETRYVSDQLVITLRSGKGTEFKVIDTLRTGDPIEVLADSGDYTKVRTGKGKEGWVRTRYISPKTPKSTVIAQLNKEIESLKAAAEDSAELAEDRERLRAENERLITANRQLEAERERTERKDLIYWFLAGAGVLFLGWLIGKSSRQKRYY